MKIAIGNDHGAVDYKNTIMEMLREEGHEVINCGTDSYESCDYVDYGKAVAEKVASGEAKKVLSFVVQVLVFQLPQIK